MTGDDPDTVDKKNVMVRVGAMLRATRHARGWTVPELVAQLPSRIGIPAYKTYESGQRTLSVPRLVEIAEVLEMTPGQLLDKALDISGVQDRTRRLAEVLRCRVEDVSDVLVRVRELTRLPVRVGATSGVTKGVTVGATDGVELAADEHRLLSSYAVRGSKPDVTGGALGWDREVITVSARLRNALGVRTSQQAVAAAAARGIEVDWPAAPPELTRESFTDCEWQVVCGLAAGDGRARIQVDVGLGREPTATLVDAVCARLCAVDDCHATALAHGLVTRITRRMHCGCCTRGSPLSPVQSEVMHAVARGAHTDHIAASLKVTEHTVKSHLKTIYTRLGTSYRPAAVAVCVANGWIEDCCGQQPRPTVARREWTPRELHMLPLLAAGHDNATIVAKVGVSLDYTKKEVAALLPRVGTRSRSHAVIILHRLGIGPVAHTPSVSDPNLAAQGTGG